MFPTFWRDQAKHLRFDLNGVLNPRPQSTVLCQIEWNDMAAAWIVDGDSLLIDRALFPTWWVLVLALIDQSYVVRYLWINEHKKQYLTKYPLVWDETPTDAHYPEESLNIIGVVVSTFRTYHE